VELRHQRLHLTQIARILQAPFSTFARVLSRLGLGQASAKVVVLR